MTITGGVSRQEAEARREAGRLFALDAGVVACPHGTLASLRAAAPVAWFDEVEAYVVTRYDDIVGVLRDPETFSSRSATGPLAERQLREAIGALAADDAELRQALHSRAKAGRSAVLLKADPPRHTRQRKLVNRAFAPLAVRGMEDEIRGVADGLIDKFEAAGEVELVHELAVPLPMTVIASALGVPPDRSDDFKRWSDDFGRAVGNHTLSAAELASVVRSQAEFFAYFAGVVAERRAQPADDLVSQIVTARIDGDELTNDEILEMVAQFLVAGNETTAKLIASAALCLARDPDLADRLREAPDLVPSFVEEVARLEPPVLGMYRVANRDATVGGVEVPAGAALWLVYAAGNRDEQQWAAPDECALGRRAEVPHLTFGLGAHLCLGAGLARAETRIAIERLLARCHDIALAPDAEVRYEPSFMLHGIARLPLTFRPPA